MAETSSMAGLKATGLFVVGALAGFGVALLEFVARVLDPKWPFLYLSSINAFVAGVVSITFGVVGGIGFANCGKTVRLRSILGGIAVLAALLGVTLEVKRRSRRFWGLTLRHQVLATVASAQHQKSRLDPRVSQEQSMALLRLAHWHSAMSRRFDRAAHVPWLPVPDFVPCKCQACAVPEGLQSDNE
jgi:hypothetical protein